MAAGTCHLAQSICLAFVKACVNKVDEILATVAEIAMRDKPHLF